MEHLSKSLVKKVETLIEGNGEIKSYSDLMPYFTTEERGHGEMDYVQFLMQNDGNPPEGGTWTEEHITYEQLKTLYDFCKENDTDDYLKLLREMDRMVLCSLPNVKKRTIKREISSKADRRILKNLKKHFLVNRPRFWMLRSGDIICQPHRRKNQFFTYYENIFGGYWFSETLVVGGNTAIVVK